MNQSAQPNESKRPVPILEICVDSIHSVIAAAAGRADRIEVCSNLPEGGTTPSTGLIRAARANFPGKIMVLIRPRAGDFLYDDSEYDVMCRDIKSARESGADGVVIGCLTPDGQIDTARCQQLQAAAGNLDVTFHRAFDMAKDLNVALETIAALGIRRILTSGGQPDAPSAASVLAGLVQRSAGRVSIMPGGGVTPDNLEELVRATGVHEVHLSARGPIQSQMQHRNHDCAMGTFSKGREYEWRETNTELVKLARQALHAAS